MTLNKISTEELFALNLIPGIGNSSIQSIIEAHLNVEHLRGYDNTFLGSLIKGSKKDEAIYQLKNNFYEYLDKAQNKIESYNNIGIKVISVVDDLYPVQYRKLTDLPSFIYVKGNLDLLNYNKNIAVIGTRDNSMHGAQVAKNITHFFASNKFNIVSGLAVGIDSIAHTSALDAKGYTTAILVDVEKVYPSSNIKLANRILDNGGLFIAENAPGTYFQKNSLVLRDRLQSGLSLAIFPIETDVKGGTMHTVGFARKQNRLIFCPNYFTSTNQEMLLQNPKMRGIKMLLDEKTAMPFSKENVEQVMKILNDRFEQLLGVTLNNEKNNILPSAPSREPADLESAYNTLNLISIQETDTRVENSETETPATKIDDAYNIQTTNYSDESGSQSLTNETHDTRNKSTNPESALHDNEVSNLDSVHTRNESNINEANYQGTSELTQDNTDVDLDKRDNKDAAQPFGRSEIHDRGEAAIVKTDLPDIETTDNKTDPYAGLPGENVIYSNIIGANHSFQPKELFEGLPSGEKVKKSHKIEAKIKSSKIKMETERKHKLKIMAEKLEEINMMEVDLNKNIFRLLQEKESINSQRMEIIKLITTMV